MVVVKVCDVVKVLLLLLKVKCDFRPGRLYLSILKEKKLLPPDL